MPKTQKGYVFREGSNWLIRFRDHRVQNGTLVRKQICRTLCRVLPEHSRLKRPPTCVKEEAKIFMARINTSNVPPERLLTIAEFVDRVYIPHIEARQAESTREHYMYFWKHVLLPRCGADMMRDFTTPKAKHLLDAIARDNSKMKKATLQRLRSLLSAIFKLAIQEGYKDAPNPMREISLPRAPESDETEAYTLEEVFALVRLLPEPAKTAVATAAFSGLRKSELCGLDWNHYDGDSLNVTQSRWRGHIGQTKSKASRAAVPVISVLKQMLDAHRARAGNPTDGAIFRGERLGRPLHLDNLSAEVIRPLLNKCKVCRASEHEPHIGHKYERDQSVPAWKGWHAFRRGLATNLHALGVDDLTIQKILRHSDVSVTHRCYIKTLPTAITGAMSQLEAAVSPYLEGLCSDCTIPAVASRLVN